MTDGADGRSAYRRRRRRRRHSWLLGLGAAALLLALSTRLSDPFDPCAAPDAAPAAEAALLPAGLSFDGIGTITRVRKDELHVTIRGVTARPPEQATVLIQDAVVAAGYRPAGMDNEGYEAEVFFTTGPYAAGRASVEPSPCPGRWDIDLVLLDRAETR